MKKIKILKTVVLFFAVFAFSNCQQNGPIQFVVVDDVTTSVIITGQATKSSFSISNSTNLSSLLSSGSSFVAANVESVIVQLVDYSGASINGILQVSAGSNTLFNQSVSLSATPSDPIAIPANASDILALISGGTMPITLSGTSTIPLEDNNFSIKLTFKIKAIVQ